MENGVVVKTEEGSPQGGNLSPLLANVYLNEFDQEFNKRGVPCIRYADDIVLLSLIHIFATPVEFGSEANDPVKYLFCLSARNNTEHLDALADLAERLEDQEFFKMLDQATDPKEVLDYLSK